METETPKISKAANLSSQLQKAAVGHLLKSRTFIVKWQTNQDVFESFTDFKHSVLAKIVFDVFAENNKIDVTLIRHEVEKMYPSDATKLAMFDAAMKAAMQAAASLNEAKVNEALANLLRTEHLTVGAKKLISTLGRDLDDTDRIIGNPTKVQEAVDDFLSTAGKLSDPKIAAGGYDYASVEERITEYERDKEEREESLKNRVSFLHPKFDNVFYLASDITLIGGATGAGKSTVLANIVCRALEANTFNILVISNEETTEGVYARIACCALDLPYVHYAGVTKVSLSEADKAKVHKYILEKVAPRVEVVTSRKHNTQAMEKVVEVLARTSRGDKTVGLVLIDYWQTIHLSSKNDSIESTQVHKKFGFHIKEYPTRGGVPLVIFAQLKPFNEDAAFTDRVQNDRTIGNHAHNHIEIEPDYENGTTKFKFHKGRNLLSQKAWVELRWKFGKFVDLQDMIDENPVDASTQTG